MDSFLRDLWPGAHMAHYHTFLLFGDEVMFSRSLAHIAYGVMIMKYLSQFRKKVTKRELKERKKKDGLFFVHFEVST